MATLPKFFVMQAPSNPTGPYLCPVEYPQSLMFEERQIFSPRVKFESEKSKTGDSTLLHIRSCFNNKYWVAHATATPGEFRIAASADKPEEDRTNPNCTLFRLTSPATTETGINFQLQSIRWSSYVRVLGNGQLTLAQAETGAFSARNWEMLVRLPSIVTFKTEDGKYMGSAYDKHGESFNWFESGWEITEEYHSRVVYQLFPTCHGSYRVKSLYNGKFWNRVEPGDWIRNDNGYSEQDPDCTFEFSIIRGDLVTIRNLGNNLLCGWDPNWLTAKFPTATKETRLIIGEPVLRRQIAISEYHLPKSRIFEGQVLLLANHSLDNSSPSEDLEESIPFSESVETSTGWDNTFSVKAGISAEFKVGVIPFIANKTIELTFDVGYEHEWGGSKTVEQKIETETKVLVPPLTKMKVKLLCTKATCEVPFSYTQTDLLPSGRTVSTVKHDGVFRGVNAYDFKVTSVVVDEHGLEVKDKPAPATIEAS